MASWRSCLVGTAVLTSVLGMGHGALAQSNTAQQSSIGSTPIMAESAPTSIALSAESSAGAKGAKTYCFMRGAGNTHKVSWDAAYALIKRQSASLFKTSPEHAAVMITEAVVNNPAAFPDCGRYIGDLYVK